MYATTTAKSGAHPGQFRRGAANTIAISAAMIAHTTHESTNLES
jgi:hypothetical protein